LHLNFICVFVLKNIDKNRQNKQKITDL